MSIVNVCLVEHNITSLTVGLKYVRFSYVHLEFAGHLVLQDSHK